MQKYTVKKFQRGSTLKLIFSVVRPKSDYADIVTEKINLDDLAEVIVIFKNSNNSNTSNPSTDLHISMKIKKKERARNFILPIKIVCDEFQEQLFCSDIWVENRIKVKSHDVSFALNGFSSSGYNKQETVLLYCFEINFTIQAKPATMPIGSILTNELYLDEEFTDFELQGTDGAVAVHRSILLAHSDMAKTMLRRVEWKESKNGCMQIDGATKNTLDHLKAYMYLGILPEESLEPLLLIAQCYLLDKLKTDCISKLVSTVKPQDIAGVVKFACENNMPDLMTAILFETPDNIVTSAYRVEIESRILNNN
ncbi:uncharacterized protein LOC125225296 [Leguminivora glycinivorella]|uniref:uncharacterized protein LOC125225296 n=1 Tax=Leguminivora glycinivorella TaxID=1035111 RepID=UPI00200C9480|nr:uncharacterized protein LOC125225296 [Leguminivora glycinivorella]